MLSHSIRIIFMLLKHSQDQYNDRRATSFVYNNEIFSLVLHVIFYHNYKISYTLLDYGKIVRDMRKLHSKDNCDMN